MIVAGWVREVLDQVGSISLTILLLALTLHTCEMLLNALAWRNILRRAYPNAGASYRLVLGAYGGGIGLNAILPAQAGTVAMLSLYRRRYRPRPRLDWWAPAPCRTPSSWSPARHDPPLRDRGPPGRVCLLCCAGGGDRDLMRAYDVPVSANTVLLILAVNAIASTFAFTPGGVGTQQALATAALHNAASSSVVAAYSFGQQLILAAWDIALGLLLLWSAIGWTATRALVHIETPTPLPARGRARPVLAEQRRHATS